MTSTLTLPTHPDLERLVLGYALMEPERLDSLRGQMDPDDFSLDSHQCIWRIICELYDGGKGVDRITVHQAALATERSGKYGGIGYLIELNDGLPERAAIGGYVERLKESTLRRRMIAVAHHLELMAADPAFPAVETLEKFTSTGAELIQGATRSTGPISTAEMMEIDGVSALLSPRKQGAISLPWPELNHALSGLSGGQVILLMAATGRGKTSMATQIAAAAALQGHAPVIWTMEMPPRSLFQRIVTQISGAPSTHRQTTFEQRNGQRMALAQLGDCPLYFDRHSRSVAAFCAGLRQVRAKTKLGLGVVDYLQLIRGTGGRSSRAQEVSDNSRALKLAALDLDIPLVVLSQVDRSSVKDGGKITLHSAKESGDIENDADVVLWIEAGELSREQPTTVALNIGKQREGPAGFPIPMIFFPTSQTFQEIARDV